MPGDEGDLRKFAYRRVELAERRQKAGEAGFALSIRVAGEMGEDETGAGFAAACEGGEDGRGEEVEGGSGGNGVAGEAEKGTASGAEAPSSFFVARFLYGLKPVPFETGISPKTKGLPGWILTPVKWNFAPRRARAGSTRSNLPAETPPEMRSMSASRGLRKRGIESFGGIGCCGQDDGFAAGVRDERGEHGGVGVADFAGPGSGVDRNEFIPRGEDGDTGTHIDLEVSISAGCGEGDLSGGEPSACGDLLIAAASLRSLGNDVVSGVDCARGDEADAATQATKTCRWGPRGVSRFFDMLKHDDAISTGRVRGLPS